MKVPAFYRTKSSNLFVFAMKDPWSAKCFPVLHGNDYWQSDPARTQYTGNSFGPRQSHGSIGYRHMGTGHCGRAAADHRFICQPDRVRYLNSWQFRS